MSEFLAAVVGAMAAYLFDVRKRQAERREATEKAEREQRKLRSTIATALLQDLRGLETTLRQFYNIEKPALWMGKAPSLYFDSLRPEIRLFAADSIPKIDEFFGRAENVFSTLSAAPEADRHKPEFNHFIRVSAGFALQSLPDAKDALVREGGVVPEPRVLEVVHYPALPTVPKPCFPDVAAPGHELPDEIR